MAVGAVLALLNSNPVNVFIDHAMALASGKHSSASMNSGMLNTYLVAPLLYSILKMANSANAIQHGGLRRGVMVMAALYVLEAFVLLAYIAVSIVIALVIIVLVIVVGVFLLSQMGSSNNRGNDYASMMGTRGSRSTHSFMGIDLPNGTRVNDKGQIMKEGMFWDSPTGMKIDDQGRLVEEGAFFDSPTGTKIDKDGRIVEEGWLIDTPTGNRIDKDGNVIEEGWLFDTKTGTRHVR